MEVHAKYEVYEDNGDLVTEYNGEEIRAKNIWILDTKLDHAGAPRGRDLVFIPESGDSNA